jgi:hypothetical protein
MGRYRAQFLEAAPEGLPTTDLAYLFFDQKEERARVVIWKTSGEVVEVHGGA